MWRILLAFLFTGCGSVFIEAPGTPPDFSECYELTKDLRGTTPKTPVKLPFSGTRGTTMWTSIPEGWEHFSGSVHLTGITWNLDWVNNMYLVVGPFSVAEWHGKEWTTSSVIDLYPALSIDDGKLRFDAKFKGDGWKPMGKQVVRVTVTVQVCGEGAEYVVVDP